MKKFVLLIGLIALTLSVFGQETVFFRAEAENSLWSNTEGSNVNNWYRSGDTWTIRRPDLANNQWSPDGTKSYNIVTFDNGVQQTTIVNDLVGGSKYYIYNILLKNNSDRIFNSTYDAYLSLGGGLGNPKIEAVSGFGTGTYTFNVPITYEKNSELDPLGGNLIFTSNINNSGFDTDVWGSSTKSVSIALMSGSGGLNIKNTTTVKITGNCTLTGGINVDFGTLELLANISSETVTVKSGATLLISENASINNLTVENGGTLNIAAGKTLTINAGKKITINGTVTNNTTGKIKLLSDGTNGTATLIGDYSGPGEVQQYLSSYRSWYMSTPLTETIIPTDNNTENPALIQSYNETNNSWPSATETGMTAGVGYMLNPGTNPGASTLAFAGTLNNGTQSEVLLTHTTANSAYKGFNLVGNPYPSYLDWTEVFAASTGISSSMWYRTKTIEGFKFWTVNGTSGIVSPVTATATKDIPPMQAFWVKANSGGGSFTLTNEMRSHAPSLNYLLKAPAAASAFNQILRLQVAGNGITDESVIYFNTNAANGYDMYDMYDSPKMMNGASSLIPDIYTTAGTEELVINGMNNIPFNTEIPLYFKANASTASTFTLKASEISNFEEGTPVFIKNNLTGEYQLISDGSDYTFNTSDAIADPAFSLIIKVPGVVTELSKPDDKQAFIYANDNRQMIVTCKDAVSLISVYNAVGQNIFTGKTNKTTTVIDNSFTPGVYLVNVNNVTKKVVVR